MNGRVAGIESNACSALQAYLLCWRARGHVVAPSPDSLKLSLTLHLAAVFLVT